MNALVVKSFQYGRNRHDQGFSPERAFCRLKGVLEVVRETCREGVVLVAVPPDESEEARSHIPLMPRERWTTVQDLTGSGIPLPEEERLLVMDEQSFYASPELVRRVAAAGDEGRSATWEDADLLLWSFNYRDACRFFVAPAGSVRRNLYRLPDFIAFQEAVLADAGRVKRHAVDHEDLPPLYGRMARFNPFPYHYYLESTSRCNSRCIMCPFHSPDPEISKGRLHLGDGGDDMPLETFLRLVDEIAAMETPYLPRYRQPQVTCQLRGEPTLAKDFRRMVSCVKEKGLRLSFSTNGSILHRDRLMEFLLDVGTDEIIVSIDGDREEYLRIRPSLDYNQVVDNIRGLRALRDRAGKDVPLIYTKRVRLRGSDEERDRKYLEAFAGIADWAGITFENFDEFTTESKGYSDYFFTVDDRLRVPCLLATDVTVVKVDGSVDMCFGAADHPIGDVNRHSLAEILSTSTLRQTILQNQAAGEFNTPEYCRSCSSWKSQYHRTEERDGYEIRLNPIMGYWKKADRNSGGRLAANSKGKRGVWHRIRHLLQAR